MEVKYEKIKCIFCNFSSENMDNFDQILQNFRQSIREASFETKEEFQSDLNVSSKNLLGTMLMVSNQDYHKTMSQISETSNFHSTKIHQGHYIVTT